MTPTVVAGRLAMAAVTAVAIVVVSRDVLDRAGSWSVPAVVATVAVLAFVVPVVHDAVPAGGVPLLVLAAAAVSYACVPETDPLLAMTVVPAVALVAEWAGRVRLPTVGVWAVVSLVLWAGVHGATGRASALVGTLFAWWPVMIAGMIAATSAGSRLRQRSTWCWALVLVPAWIAAAIVARSGALADTIRPALLGVAVALPSSAIAAAAIAAGFAGRQRAG